MHSVSVACSTYSQGNRYREGLLVYSGDCSKHSRPSCLFVSFNCLPQLYIWSQRFADIWRARLGVGVVIPKPMLDFRPLVGEPCGGDHGVSHDLKTDRAEELIGQRTGGIRHNTLGLRNWAEIRHCQHGLGLRNWHTTRSGRWYCPFLRNR